MLLNFLILAGNKEELAKILPEKMLLVIDRKYSESLEIACCRATSTPSLLTRADHEAATLVAGACSGPASTRGVVIPGLGASRAPEIFFHAPRVLIFVCLFLRKETDGKNWSQ